MTKFTSDQIRSTISKFIDTYIQEKIDLAQQQIVSVGKELISKRKKEQIMVMGTTTIFDELFRQLHDDSVKFTVVVVDTSPQFAGRALLERLSRHGV